MTTDLLSALSSAALKKIGGTALEHDADKLEQLARVVLEEQAQVVQCHLALGVPWADALVGKTLRPVEGSGVADSRGLPVPNQSSSRQVERRTVDDLKPNRFNGALFPDSLSESSIDRLADDLARSGQRVPVEVTPAGEIVDGERRWRGARKLGWNEIEVVVCPDLSGEEILDRVLDSCTSARQMSLREQVNVYTAVCERLKRDAGRQQGRPEKTFQNGNVFLTPQSVRDAAAKQAGFSSAALAIRAEAVLTRGSDDLQSRVRDGSLSISAAYDLLPKRPKAMAAPEPVDVQQDTRERVNDANGHSEVLAAAAPVASPAGLDDNGSDADAEIQADAGEEPTEAEDTDDDNDDRGGAPAALQHAPSPALVTNHNIGHHVEQVCSYVASVAERDYDEASAWVDRLVKMLKASLGDRPSFSEASLDALLHLS